MVTQYFGRVPKATRPVPRDIPKEPAQAKERRAVVEEAWPLPAVVVAYHVTYDGHPDAYPLHITAKILSDGQSARIPRELMYKKRIALTAFGSGNITEDPNLFYAVAIVQPGQTPAAAEQALIAEFDKLTKEPVLATELQRAKNQFARDYIVEPRVQRGQGAAPGARRRDPQRHRRGRRRVRHLHERDAPPTCSAWPRPTSRRTTASCFTSFPRAGGSR